MELYTNPNVKGQCLELDVLAKHLSEMLPYEKVKWTKSLRRTDVGERRRLMKNYKHKHHASLIRNIKN